jgi:hypothetical protein
MSRETSGYSQNVAELARRADGSLIINRTPEHAAVIVEWIFRCSFELIEILTSRLSLLVYSNPELIDQALHFLNRRTDASICILTETSIDPRSHPFFRAILAAGFADRVKLRLISAESLLKAYEFNFALGDSRHFRLEKSRNSFDSIAQFGAPDIGEKLHNTFFSLWKDSVRLLDEQQKQLA